MDNAMGVEVGKGQGYVMAEIHLGVVGEWFVGSLQKLSQTLIH